MNRVSRLSPGDLETLSAYLDGVLSPEETSHLEARLSREQELRGALHELRATVDLLRSLPEVRLPRSFTLKPETAGVRRTARAYPALRLATVVATLAFMTTVGLDALTRVVQPAGLRAMAPAAEAPAAAAPQLSQELPAPAATLGETEAVAADRLAVSPTAEAEMMLQAVGPTPTAMETLIVPKEAGAAQATPPPTTVLGAAAPAEGPAATAESRCETCGEELILPTAEKGDQVLKNAVVASATPVPTATPFPQAYAARTETSEIAAPSLRLFEIGFAALALALGVLTIRSRRKT
jgi:anti-sigma factor RsiW